MAQEYTKADEILANAMILQYFGGPAQPLDELTIPFQFPPKITNDSRRGEWSEPEVPGTEPIATYKASGPREITLTTSYVIDGSKWSVDRVSKILKSLRGYFSRTRLGLDGKGLVGSQNLVVILKLWAIGGNDFMTGRIKCVNIKYSDTIVGPCRQIEGNENELNTQAQTLDSDKAFPLRSDVTLDLRLWTQGGPASIVQNLVGLNTNETPDWY